MSCTSSAPDNVQPLWWRMCLSQSYNLQDLRGKGHTGIIHSSRSLQQPSGRRLMAWDALLSCMCRFLIFHRHSHPKPALLVEFSITLSSIYSLASLAVRLLHKLSYGGVRYLCGIVEVHFTGCTGSIAEVRIERIAEVWDERTRLIVVDWQKAGDILVWDVRDDCIH